MLVCYLELKRRIMPEIMTAQETKAYVAVVQ